MALTGFSDAIYVEHGSAAALDDMAVGTAAFWVYTTSDTARQIIVSKFGAGTRGIELGEQATPSTLGGNIPRATVGNIAYASVANFAHYAINKWLFVVWQFDTVTASVNNKMWVGDQYNRAAEPSAYTSQEMGSGALTTDAAGNWRVGRHGSAASRQFVGRIATHYLTNTLLPPTEIWRLQKTGRILNESALLIRTQYGLSSATATQADLTGKGNHGTVIGTPTLAAHVPPMFVHPNVRCYLVTSAAAGGGGGAVVNIFTGRGGAAAQPLAA